MCTSHASVHEGTAVAIFGVCASIVGVPGTLFSAGSDTHLVKTLNKQLFFKLWARNCETSPKRVLLEVPHVSDGLRPTHLTLETPAPRLRVLPRYPRDALRERWRVACGACVQHFLRPRPRRCTLSPGSEETCPRAHVLPHVLL